MTKAMGGISVAVLSLFNGMAAAEPVTIVRPGGPLPSVVTTDQKSDRDSAADFCDYFSRVTGRKVAISDAPAAEGVIFHIGPDAFVAKHAPEIDKLYADGYIVKLVNSGGRNHIVLAGKIPPSSQWAIEQFLQDYCGVRWLFPDPKYGEIVPSQQTITVESTLSKTYEPDFVSRGNLAMYYFTPARYYLRLRVRGYPFGEHQLQRIFSTEEFKAHPEWFAYFMDNAQTKSGRGWENGQPKMRRQWWKYGNGWQICTSNPETVQYAVEHILKKFGNTDYEYYRHSPTVSVGHNDGAGWCECPECQKLVNSFDPPLTISERWWYWVNQVAREVAKTYPDKWVESMAYAASSQPPRFSLEPNVAITKTFVLDNELDLAKQWMEKCRSVNIYTYMFGNYFLGFRHYPHAAKDFLKWGHEELGAMSHVTECGGDWTFDGPKFHYLQQLHWDVNVDVDVVMDDFCRTWYGPKAARPMRAFWDRLEKIYERRRPVPSGMKNRRLLFYQWVGWVNSSYVQPNDELQEHTLEDVEFLDKRIAEATELGASEDEGVQFRLDRIHDAWKYFRTFVVSFGRFYPMSLESRVDSQQTRQDALKTASEIADLRADRMFYLARMRAYPIVNPRMARRGYWQGPEEMTIFSHERSLVDTLCTSVSSHIKTEDGPDAALGFWHQIPVTSNLYEAAQTQVYMLGRDDFSNVLVNGGFETGNTEGWDVSGASVNVTKDQARSGSYAARTAGSTTLSQKVAVSPLERYRLAVWGRYLTEPRATDVAMDLILDFYSATKRIWSEPSRQVMRSKNPADGWVCLSSTLTVPPGADSVVVKLRNKAAAGILWDDVAFEKIKEGPKFEHGLLSDDFTGNRPSYEKWTAATDVRGTVAPKVAGGYLVRDDEKMYGLTSLARFDDLLKFEAEDRYCLRIHAKPAGTARGGSSFIWGIKTGTKTIGSGSTRNTGMYWTHYFSSVDNSSPRLVCHAIQDGKVSSTEVFTGVHLKMKYTLKLLENSADEVWYSFYFDPQYVTVYASAAGYREDEASLVAAYEHGIKDLTSKGPVYLKLGSGGYQLDQISLSGAGVQAAKLRHEGKPAPIEEDAEVLIMPGVTD